MYRVYNERTGYVEYMSTEWWKVILYLVVNYGENHPDREYVRYEELGDWVI